MDRVVWAPQVGPQKALIDCPLPEIFFGGARGGGKTDGVLGKYILKALRFGAGFNALFCRRELPMLDDAIERSKQIYGSLGAKWNDQAKTWRFPGGGRLRFRPLERLDDADKYQGQNISDVCVEEAGQYPDPRPIDRLHAVLRSAAGVPTQLILTGNPGGAGQSWIRARFIDPAPGGWRPIERRIELPAWAGGQVVVRKSVFIPSKVSDNRFLGPDYVAGLHLVGSEALVRAWLEGDWDAVEGAFFDTWSNRRHVVNPFEIPAHWLRFRSMDWGFAAPFSVGWWAVASEPWPVPSQRDHTDHGGQFAEHGAGSATRGISVLPRGCLIRYREWCGADIKGAGLRLEAEQISTGVASREQAEPIQYGVVDTQVFAQDGKAYGYTGPTIGERMNKTLGEAKHAIWRPADKSRKQGWDQVRQRLHGDVEGNPMLVVFSTCLYIIRTLPVLQHSTVDPEDLDTEGDDHGADELRYACQSRPWARATPRPDQPLINVAVPTLADLVKRTDRVRNGARKRI